jgi:hypothetical protein
LWEYPSRGLFLIFSFRRLLVFITSTSLHGTLYSRLFVPPIRLPRAFTRIAHLFTEFTLCNPNIGSSHAPAFLKLSLGILPYRAHAPSRPNILHSPHLTLHKYEVPAHMTIRCATVYPSHDSTAPHVPHPQILLYSRKFPVQRSACRPTIFVGSASHCTTFRLLSALEFWFAVFQPVSSPFVMQVWSDGEACLRVTMILDISGGGVCW